MAEEKNANEGILETHILFLSYIDLTIHTSIITCLLDMLQISEEEGRLKKDEEEAQEMWKRKREHEEQWEGTREKRVCFEITLLYHLYCIFTCAFHQEDCFELN